MEKTITKFIGNGCINCRAMTPIMEAVKKEHSDIKFNEINVSTDTGAADKHDITTLPTLVFLRDGKEVARMTGLKPKSLVLKKIQEVF